MTWRFRIPGANSCAAEASIEKVWFRDNEVWRRNPANAVEYTPNALPVSRALTNLQYVAGETAVGFPVMENGLWICVCGRPNPEEETVCVRCGRARDAIFENPLVKGIPIVFLKADRYIWQLIHEYLSYYYNFTNMDGGELMVLNKNCLSTNAENPTFGSSHFSVYIPVKREALDWHDKPTHPVKHI